MLMLKFYHLANLLYKVRLKFYQVEVSTGYSSTFHPVEILSDSKSPLQICSFYPVEILSGWTLSGNSSTLHPVEILSELELPLCLSNWNFNRLVFHKPSVNYRLNLRTSWWPTFGNGRIAWAKSSNRKRVPPVSQFACSSGFNQLPTELRMLGGPTLVYVRGSYRWNSNGE